MLRGRGTLARIASAATVVLLTACSNPDPGAAEGSGASERPPWDEVSTEPAWTLGGYTPVSPVQATDGGFVLYALDEDGDLAAIGVDAADGEVRWQHPASPSYVVRGVGMHIAVREGLAVFLTPSDPGQASSGEVDVVAVDAVTGEIENHYRGERFVTDQPSFCDEGRLLCLIGGEGSDLVWQVVDLQADRDTTMVPVEDPRTLSDNLFPTNNSSDLLRIEFDGTETWQRPTAELFGGAAVSPDHGWHIRNQDGRYVGQLGVGWDEDPDGTFRRDLGDRVTAAFDEATGEPLWHEPGTFLCFGIDFTLDYPVRCRGTGAWASFEGEEGQLTGQITVEGFDPATGETRWAWEAGEVPGLVFFHESLHRVDDTAYLVATDDGDLLLDVAAGEWLPAADSTPGWCSDFASYPLATGVIEDDELAVTEWWPCDVEGEPLELPVTVPEFAGALTGGVFAWVVQGELRAVTVTD